MQQYQYTYQPYLLRFDNFSICTYDVNAGVSVSANTHARANENKTHETTQYPYKWF